LELKADSVLKKNNVVCKSKKCFENCGFRGLVLEAGFGLGFLGRQPGFPHYSAGTERLAQLVCGGSSRRLRT